MTDDLAPAIDYARDGFPVTQLIAHYWKGNMAAFEQARRASSKNSTTRAHTYLIDGHAPAEGEIFKNPDLAHTYELIAKGGRDAFYKGEIAHTIDAYFKRIGGDLRYEDFAAHHGEWVEPLSVNYRGYDVYELPPNGQGAAALQMLQHPQGLRSEERWAPARPMRSPRCSKPSAWPSKISPNGMRDPAFVHVPMKGLLSDAYADERRKLIDLRPRQPDIGPGDPHAA